MNLQSATTVAVYGVLLVGAVIGTHYAFIDPQLAGGIIGACLTHFGLNYAPSTPNAIVPAQTAIVEAPQK